MCRRNDIGGDSGGTACYKNRTNLEQKQAIYLTTTLVNIFRGQRSLNPRVMTHAFRRGIQRGFSGDNTPSGDTDSKHQRNHSVLSTSQADTVMHNPVTAKRRPAIKARERCKPS